MQTFLHLLYIYIYFVIKWYIFIQTLSTSRVWHKVIFKWGLTGSDSFFLTCCYTKVKESCLSYYLPIAVGRIIQYLPFPRVLVLCEMQKAPSKIWNQFAMSISYDDSHYTMNTYSVCVCVCVSIYRVFLKQI